MVRIIRQGKTHLLFAFGWLDSASQYYIGTSEQRAQWLDSQPSTNDVPDRDPSDGVVLLGAGWRLGDPSKELILSVPKGRKPSLRFVVAMLINGYRSGRSDSELKTDSAKFFDALFSLRSGKELLKTITIAPAVSEDDHPRVRVVLRPDRDDDGDDCECESSFTPVM